MSVTKATVTVAGEASVGALTVQQYSIRVPIVIPTMRVVPATHKQSTSTTRYLYFAEPHGLVVGDRFIPGGFNDSLFDAEVDKVLNFVTAVGADYIAYSKYGASTLAKTAVSAGGILVPGFNGLRMAFRHRVTATGALTGADHSFVYGFSTGAYPVGHAQCGGWSGYGSRGGSYTFSANRLSIVNTNAFVSVLKSGATWTPTGLAYNTTVSASRDNPDIRVIDVMPNPSNAYFGLTKGLCSAAGLTRQQFLNVLRFPEAMNNADKSLGGLAFTNQFLTNENDPAKLGALRYSATPSLYLEIASRDPTFGIEVFDIGYSYW